MVIFTMLNHTAIKMSGLNIPYDHWEKQVTKISMARCIFYNSVTHQIIV